MAEVVLVKQKRKAGTHEKSSTRLLDLQSAAQYLGISFWTMRGLVFAGQVPTVKIPSPRAGDGRTIRRVLIDRNDLDALIERNKETENA